MERESMKVIILAGGLGTRIQEETETIPKPMVQVGGKPILWHIMKLYSYYGFNDFIICLGYKGYVIKEYFSHYFLHNSNVTINMATQKMQIHNGCADDWNVTLIDTGLDTMTGGRIRQVRDYIGDDTFMLTYGDGVGDVNIRRLLQFHRRSKKLATVTAIQIAGRFGALELSDNKVKSFFEKPKRDSWVNGGFFVLEPAVIDLIDNDYVIFEKAPLKDLAKRNELIAYKHHGFWKCMDTLRDKIELEQLWTKGEALWKVWR